MKLFLFFFCFFFLLQDGLLAQTTSRKQGIYMEYYALKHAFCRGHFSLNYEHRLGAKQRAILRAGIYPDFRTLLCVPLTFSWVTFPEKNHHFEYGLGAVYRLEFYNQKVYKDFPAVMIPLMYRYEKQSAWIVRAGINLWLSWPSLPSPSASLGYRF